MDTKSCAYKEIYEILKIFPADLVDKIPQETMDFFYNNMDRDYQYNITVSTFDGKTMLEETVAILTILFRDYWATPSQKEKIVNFQKGTEKKLQQEAMQKYNPNDIFKNENTVQKEIIEVPKEINNEENFSKDLLVEAKEHNPFKRLISFIKRKLGK